MSHAAPLVPRRVLLTADVVGGVWDWALCLAEALRPLGWEPTIVVVGSPSVSHEREAARRGIPLLSAPLRLEWMQDSAEDVRRTQAWVSDLVHELAPDVVHASQFAVAAGELPSPVVLTTHSDVLSWRRWVQGERRPSAEWAHYARLVRQALLAADEVAAVSGFLAVETKDQNTNKQPNRENHNRKPTTNQTPTQHKHERLTVLAGRAGDEAKNVGLPALVAAAWPHVGRVVLAGSQHHPETGGLAELPGCVESLGHLSHHELERYLDHASAYVSAARYDPFGLLPLQAALAGCPLLLSGIPSYRELWDGAALFFAPNDEQALRALWQRVLDREPGTMERAEKARQRALERFTPARMAAGYAALYDRAIRTSRKAGERGERIAVGAAA